MAKASKNYWWNKGDRTGQKKKVSEKYWFMGNHNTHDHLRMPTAMKQTFLFALCWNILTRAAFCLFFLFFCDSLSLSCLPFSPFLRLLFTDLRTQWFLSILILENIILVEFLACWEIDKILQWQTDIERFTHMAFMRKVYCSLSRGLLMEFLLWINFSQHDIFLFFFLSLHFFGSVQFHWLNHGENWAEVMEKIVSGNLTASAFTFTFAALSLTSLGSVLLI